MPNLSGTNKHGINHSNADVFRQVANRRMFVGNAYMTKHDKYWHYSNLKILMETITDNIPN